LEKAERYDKSIFLTLQADDDTYVVMEHMYDYLATLDPNKPYYLGYRLKPHLPKGYNGGGAGYVLSRAAVKLFLEQAFHDRTLCPIDMHEDVGMGRSVIHDFVYFATAMAPHSCDYPGSGVLFLKAAC
uniref:N-acetylgalactosaminide beta-1,3-galactosyltransferase n=1 Tax=Heligmosomoides polygyrus TaxID=6339 RepID=A0A183F6R1_HELPZ